MSQCLPVPSRFVILLIINHLHLCPTHPAYCAFKITHSRQILFNVWTPNEPNERRSPATSHSSTSNFYIFPFWWIWIDGGGASEISRVFLYVHVLLTCRHAHTEWRRSLTFQLRRDFSARNQDASFSRLLFWCKVSDVCRQIYFIFVHFFLSKEKAEMICSCVIHCVTMETWTSLLNVATCWWSTVASF